MPAPVLNPPVQYTPTNFAHGSIPDVSSRIPSICGYLLPEGQGFIELITPGYFGSQQYRPSIGSGPFTSGPPDYHTPGDPTDSVNQGQPSVGTTLPFGSLVFWANNPADTAANGFAVRIDPNGTGYGIPWAKLVTVTGGVF